MAIQIPNPGTGNGATGDNEFVLWSKVKDNFIDVTNAASKLVGAAAGQVPLAENAFRATYGVTGLRTSTTINDANNILPGDRVLISAPTTNTPVANESWTIESRYTYSGSFIGFYQVAHGYHSNSIWVRTKNKDSFSDWTEITTITTYGRTTASGANVVIGTNGQLMRSTSSERYKDILANLVLDDAAYANAMELAPIVYRSTAEADNPDYHHYSFSAEALGAFDPAFTLWRETETFTDDEGNTIEQKLDERQAEGININALLAFSHAIAIKQDKLIQALTARVAALEAR